MLSDLIYLIQTANLGTEGIDIFKGAKAVIPTGDGPYISLIVTPGLTPEGTHNLTSVPAYVRPSAQVVVRAKQSDVAEARARALWELLYPVRDRLVNGTWWRSVTLVQEPFDLGLDDVGRPRWAFNMSVVKRLSPAYS
jgi:hypothetical protein